MLRKHTGLDSPRSGLHFSLVWPGLRTRHTLLHVCKSSQSLRQSAVHVKLYVRLTAVQPDALHRSTRSSPTRFVTLSRSRYSSNGIAYLRETPVRSLNEAMFSFGVLLFCATTNWRRPSRDRKI